MSMRKMLLACISIAIMHPVSSGAIELIPLDDFVKPDQFKQPRLSPDGKHIAIQINLPQGDRYVPTMSVFELPGFQMKSAIRMPAFEVPLDYQWLSNTRLAITKATEYGSQEAPLPTGEVLATNLDGTKQEYLYGYKMFKTSSRGGRFDDDYGHGVIAGIPAAHNGTFLLQEHKWDGKHTTLYEINSLTVSRKTLADIAIPYLDFTVQHNGVPRFASGNDENNRGVLFRRDLVKDEWKQITDGNLGWGFHPIGFSPDDSELYATYTENGEPAVLVRQSMNNDKRITIADHKEGTADILQWDVKRLTPFASGTSVGVPKLIYLDETMPEAKLHQSLSAQFPDAFINFIDFSEDGNKLLFSVASDRDPGSYYLFDRTTKKAQLLFSSMEQINPEQMAPRLAISFKTRDGLTLHGYLTMPLVKDKHKVPLVLMPHGGPHDAQDTWFYDNDAQFLASRGYAVLQINYRGSGGRGANFKRSGFRHWGDLIQNDLIDGVKWTIGQGKIDPQRVCAYGASFGAYSAMMVTIRAPGMFKCAIGYAGVYDLPMIYKHEGVMRNKGTHSAMLDYIGKDATELQRNSPSHLAEKISAPVLIVHGEQDKIAPFFHAESLRTALIKAKKPYEWMQVANEGHGFYATKNIRAFYQNLEIFLAKHLAQ
ncbi:alpha/beta hydrolase family protein [Undibacterium sp. RuTC16W]|uniref:alpha/beta hydrolase family protein n=1 Tax=Undibacterium sp. RuTC16W TaxID=3413048 RepID=UPI003BF3D391